MMTENVIITRWGYNACIALTMVVKNIKSHTLKKSWLKYFNYHNFFLFKARNTLALNTIIYNTVAHTGIKINYPQFHKQHWTSSNFINNRVHTSTLVKKKTWAKKHPNTH